MSERINDPTFEDYSWIDHEREVHSNIQGINQNQQSTSVVDAEKRDSNLTNAPSTSSPALLDQFDRNKNSEWYGQQHTINTEEVPTNHSQSHALSNQTLDYKTHPDYSKSLEKVTKDQHFSFDGNDYFRHKGATYRSQNMYPFGKYLPPEQAEKIDSERARRHMDSPVYEVNGPVEAVSSALSGGLFSFLRGGTAASIATEAAKSFAKSAFSSAVKNTMSDTK